MNQDRNKILVTGVGGPAGRATTEFLRSRNFRVLACDMRPQPGPGDFRTLPPAADPAFVEALLRCVSEEGVGLLIPTVTEELVLVAERREDLHALGCGLFISPAESARIIDDKWETARALAKHGLSAPPSYCGPSTKEMLQTLSPPILSKPRQGRGGRGIEIHRTPRDLPDKPDPDRVYQAFLLGEEYDVNLFARPDGGPTVTVVLKKTAMKSGEVGNALSVERTTAPDVAALAEKTVKALGLEGPLDMDIRRDGSGRPAVLEINGRIGANIRSAEEVLLALLDHWKEHPCCA